MRRNGKLKKIDEVKDGTTASVVYQAVERYAFFLGASFLWYLIVSQSLKWLQFPVHLHRLEVLGAYILPIILIYFVLKLVDWVLAD